MAAGEASLFVRVTARHRREAFKGASNHRAPKKAGTIWKHPIYAGFKWHEFPNRLTILRLILTLPFVSALSSPFRAPNGWPFLYIV